MLAIEETSWKSDRFRQFQLKSRIFRKWSSKAFDKCIRKQLRANVYYKYRLLSNIMNGWTLILSNNHSQNLFADYFIRKRKSQDMVKLFMNWKRKWEQGQKDQKMINEFIHAAQCSNLGKKLEFWRLRLKRLRDIKKAETQDRQNTLLYYFEYWSIQKEKLNAKKEAELVVMNRYLNRYVQKYFDHWLLVTELKQKGDEYHDRWVEIHAMRLKRFYLFMWKTETGLRLNQKRQYLELKQEFRLMRLKRAFFSWRTEYKLRESAHQSLKQADEKHCIQMKSKAMLSWKLVIQSSNHIQTFHQKILKHLFVYWKKQTVQKIHFKNQHVMFPAIKFERLYLMKKAFHCMRNCIQEKYQTKKKKQRAIEYAIQKQYQWIFHTWKLYTNDQYYHREQKIKANQLYKKRLLNHSFSHWNRLLEQQFLERKNMIKSDTHYIETLKQKCFTMLISRIQRKKVMVHFREQDAQRLGKKLLNHCWLSWKKKTSLCRLFKIYQPKRIQLFYFVKWSNAFSRQWTLKVKEKQMTEVRSILFLSELFLYWKKRYDFYQHISKVSIYRPMIVESTFLHWKSLAILKRSNHQKDQMAGQHFKQQLIQKCLYTWLDYALLLKEQKAKESAIATRVQYHVSRVMLRTILYQWKAYCQTKEKHALMRIKANYWHEKRHLTTSIVKWIGTFQMKLWQKYSIAMIHRLERKRKLQKPFLHWKSKRKDWKRIYERCYLVPQSLYRECLLKRVVNAWKEWATASASDRQARVGLWIQEYQQMEKDTKSDTERMKSSFLVEEEVTEIKLDYRSERLEPRIPSFLVDEDLLDFQADLNVYHSDRVNNFKGSEQFLNYTNDDYLLNHSIMQLIAKDLK